MSTRNDAIRYSLYAVLAVTVCTTSVIIILRVSEIPHTQQVTNNERRASVHVRAELQTSMRDHDSDSDRRVECTLLIHNMLFVQFS